MNILYFSKIGKVVFHLCVPILNFAFIFLDDIDLELRLARFEQLIARRPLLLNSVLLRQNPHNVHEWHKRVKLYDGNPRQVREFKEVQFVIMKLLFSNYACLLLI